MNDYQEPKARQDRQEDIERCFPLRPQRPLRSSCRWAALPIAVAIVISVEAQQFFTGRLTDSACGASHQMKAASTAPGAGALTDRQCLLACIKALATYALVDQNNQVIPIANQDAMGLPLYAGRPVKITGESKGGAIYVTKVEAIPAHLHLGHVMTNWRDTPGSRGFLPVAVDEARIALLHARLAAKAGAGSPGNPGSPGSIDEIRLHLGHVLHALDPAVEPKGPGAGYGVKRAAAGAQQHLALAAKAEGATAAVTADAAHVSTALADVLLWVDQAIAAAQKARAATDGADAARAAADLAVLAQRIDDELEQLQTRMGLLLKTEGLLGAPR